MSTIVRSLIWIYTLCSVLCKLYPSSTHRFLLSSPAWNVTRFNRSCLAPLPRHPSCFHLSLISSLLLLPISWNYRRFHCITKWQLIRENKLMCNERITNEQVEEQAPLYPSSEGIFPLSTTLAHAESRMRVFHLRAFPLGCLNYFRGDNWMPHVMFEQSAGDVVVVRHQKCSCFIVAPIHRNITKRQNYIKSATSSLKR